MTTPAPPPLAEGEHLTTVGALRALPDADEWEVRLSISDQWHPAKVYLPALDHRRRRPYRALPDAERWRVRSVNHSAWTDPAYWMDADIVIARRKPVPVAKVPVDVLKALAWFWEWNGSPPRGLSVGVLTKAKAAIAEAEKENP